VTKVCGDMLGYLAAARFPVPQFAA